MPVFRKSQFFPKSQFFSEVSIFSKFPKMYVKLQGGGPPRPPVPYAYGHKGELQARNFAHYAKLKRFIYMAMTS